MFDNFKYPRTYHLPGSKGIVDPQAKNFPQGSMLAIEEKVDGSTVGIYFDDSANLRVFHRNQPAHGKEFHQLRNWLESIADDLFSVLEDRYVMYGEWLYWCHTIRYSKLPSFFLEYDILDKSCYRFLSTPKRHDLIRNLPISSVRVLGRDIYTLDKLASFFGNSTYGIEPMEGLYVKEEDDDWVLGRYKYIQKSFLDRVLSSSHWSKRNPPIKNSLI